MKFTPLYTLVFLFIYGITVPAAPVSLFDGTLGTLPNTQNMYYADPSPLLGQPPALVSAGATGTTLSSVISNGTRAGFYTYDTVIGQAQKTPLVLDRAVGYSVYFDFTLIADQSASVDRAGTSLLVLGDDNFGIEIAFDSSGVFPQSVDFTKGALGWPGIPTGERTNAILTIQDDDFNLSYDGNDVSGALVDYTENPAVLAALGNPLNAYHVYNLNNFIFFGDNTTSAGANTVFHKLEVGEAVPEPSSMLLLLASLLGLVALRRKSSSRTL